MRRKLVLPQGYKFKPINEYFAVSPAVLPVEVERQAIAEEPVVFSPPQIDHPINNSQASSESEFNSQDILKAEQELNNPRPLKRLKRRANAPIKDDLPPEFNLSSEGFDAASDDSSDFETDLDDRHRRQLADNGWLQRVTETLQELSMPVQNDDGNLREKFLLLKKKWGYVNKFKSVDSEDHDCPLCEHKHVSVLFKIENFQTHKKVYAGSHCITQFRVMNEEKDGLLDKLTSREIIDEAIREAYKERAEDRRQRRRFLW